MIWRAVILGIDPGQTSGVSLWIGDECRGAWTVVLASERRATIADAVAAGEGLPLVICGESWSGGWSSERSSARTIAGLGAAWGRWQEAAEAAGVRPSQFIRVHTARWRSDVLGGRQARTAEHWKAAARAWCAAHEIEIDSDDAAEAACIGWWATRVPQTARALRLPRSCRRCPQQCPQRPAKGRPDWCPIARGRTI